MNRRPLIFIIFTSAYFLSYFYRLANAVISPDLSADIGLNPAQLGLMTSVFFATFAAVQIPLGIGLDRWGPRWVTSGLMIIGVAGSLMFATAQSFIWLTIGRGLIGIGMAGILMGSLKAFSQWYPPKRFATMSGLLVGIGSTGALFAATPLAWLNEQIGWRTVFVGMAVVTLFVAVIIMTFGRNTPPGKEWPKPEKAKGGVGQVLKDGRFWRIAPVSMFASGTSLAFQGLWAGPYLFDIHGLSKIEGGNILLLIGIGATIGFVLSGWIADRFSLAHVVLFGTILFAFVQIILAIRPSLAIVRLMFFLFGFSGAFNILVLAHIRRLFPDSITGQAITAINLFGFAGTFLIQWLMGVIIGSFVVSANGAYPPQAYTTVLLVTAACNLLVLTRYYPLTKTDHPVMQTA
ncbi:MAG: nitrate/nitrite transporter [Anaerolineae bacterium]